MVMNAAQLCGLAPRAAAGEITALLTRAGCPDADFDARELVRVVCGGDPLLCAAPLTQEQAQRLSALACRRASREPLQYLLGSWPFLDFELAVGPGVLCPRADTETVIEALREAPSLRGREDAPLRVLDLCAGTGALGIGFARFFPRSEVCCVEKSPDALAYLRRNAENALPGRHVSAAQGDLFEWHKTLAEESLDVILCNPPYLTQTELLDLQPEVAREPRMALDGGADGLVFYRALAAFYRRPLRTGGLLALEIGWQQEQSVTELLRESGWHNVRCRKDWGGNPRCILAEK